MNSLAFGIFAGVFGIAYFMYGKRRDKWVFMGSGILLNVYPYCVFRVIVTGDFGKA